MAVVVACAAAGGAWLGRGPSPWFGAFAVVVALTVGRPWLLVVATLVLTGGLSARAADGLGSVTPGAFAGRVTLVADPEPGVGSGWRADVRLADGRHLEAIARSPDAAAAFRDRAAGQVLDVRGRLQRPPPGSDWLRNRHVVGQLAIDQVDAWSPGPLPARAANEVRALLQRGASVLPDRQRPLFSGFVLGDTRGQSPDLADDFQGAGLTHLLAVSGENVAFVLALAGPLLRRVSLRPRWAATLAVIAFFALVTRFEPSVLRASAMAAFAVTATTLGREASGLRILSLAVAALLVLDPFLVWSVGFQLSVAASAGILLLVPPLSRHLPGPRVVADALAVTIAAQTGVAPVLVTVFGGLPLASVPANLLAAPAAAAVMVWGVGAGLAAGALGPRVASILHWPTSLLLWWVTAVAHWGASLPIGELGPRHLVVLAVGAALVLAARRFGHGHRARTVGSAARWAGCALLVVALVEPALALRSPPSGPVAVGSGAVLWRAGGGSLLELDGRADVADLLAALRGTGTRRLDVVVARTSSSATASTIDALRHWGDVGQVVAPPGSAVPEATVAQGPVELRPGVLDVVVTPDGDRLRVDVRAQTPV